MRIQSLAIAATVVSCLAAPARSAVTFTGNAATRSASATFDIAGGKLQVVLSNVSAVDPLAPVDVLTGVFFNIAGGTGGISSFSAIPVGTAFLNEAAARGGEWASNGTVAESSLPGIDAGISGAGPGFFGGATFPAASLSGMPALDGNRYGITSAGINVATDAGRLRRNNITRSALSFLLNAPIGLDLSKIGSAVFQYGTAPNKP